MASKTYSERVNIIKYVKAAKGWRFAPVVNGLPDLLYQLDC